MTLLEVILIIVLSVLLPIVIYLFIEFYLQMRIDIRLKELKLLEEEFKLDQMFNKAYEDYLKEEKKNENV